MGMEIKDERGRLLYSTDPAATPVPPKNSIRFRERDVPMIALKKFRAPGTSGNCWPGDTFNLLPAEVDHFERNGLAKRKPAAIAEPPDAEPQDAEIPKGDPDEQGPSLAKVERHPSKRKFRR